MHMVECPHCHRKFKVPSPVTDRRMRCGRCGEEFTGSSVGTADAAGQAGPVRSGPGSVFHSTLEPRQGRRETSTKNVIMLVACFFGIVA